LDEAIRATISGLHYAVKWKRPYYGLAERGWIIELAAYDVSVNVVFLGGADFDSPPPAARNQRPSPVRQGDHSGGDTPTRTAHVDRGGEPHAGLDVIRAFPDVGAACAWDPLLRIEPQKEAPVATAVQALVERVEELLPTGDSEAVWGNPLLSVTPVPVSIHGLAVRTEALERAVIEIAREVQRLSEQQE
jgi:hypothetical protein